MKQNLLTWVTSGILMGSSLAGCSSDSLVGGDPEVVEQDSQVFIRVKLADTGSESTRADNSDNTDPDNYHNGTTAEMKIHKVLFVFYDALGNYIAHTPLDVTKADTDFGTESGSLETILDIIVPVELKEGQLKPEYVMAYVNPTSKADNELSQAFNRVQTKTRTLEDVIPGENHMGYTMNNSVYYTEVDGDQPVIAAKLPENALFESEEAARQYDGDDKNAVIWVERVVAKVILTQKDSDKNDIANLTQNNNTATSADENKTVYTLEFEPLAWGVNNVEPETFLIKNFRKEEVNSTPVNNLASITNLNYGDANSAAYMKSLTSPSWNYYLPESGSTDNAKGGHRTFWAYSTTYYDQGAYPENADIYDKNKGNKFNLTYRSYNDIYDTKGGENQKGAIGKYGSAIKNGKPLYTLEHTMRPNVVAKNMLRAVSSVTVVGRYTIKVDDTPFDEGTSFYLQRKTGEGANHTIYVGETDMKTAFLNKNDAIYVKQQAQTEGEDDQTSTEPTYVAVTANETYLSDFKVDHPKPEVYNAFVPTASRYVTLQFADDVQLTDDGNKPKYYIRNGASYEAVTTGNLTQANQELFSSMTDHFNPVESFKSGMAYFNVPIKHLWGFKTGLKEIGDEDFTATLGQYGVVRNHVYTINIQGISGIGTGINNPDDPIIPNVPKKQYYVHSEIRVQKWRIVPLQNVTLKPY